MSSAELEGLPLRPGAEKATAGGDWVSQALAGVEGWATEDGPVSYWVCVWRGALCFLGKPGEVVGIGKHSEPAS